jgi:hypothetical protein
MSLRGAPARRARAGPSPVLIRAFVEREKILPNPPVARRVAREANPWTAPVRI